MIDLGSLYYFFLKLMMKLFTKLLLKINIFLNKNKLFFLFVVFCWNLLFHTQGLLRAITLSWLMCTNENRMKLMCENCGKFN